MNQQRFPLLRSTIRTLLPSAAARDRLARQLDRWNRHGKATVAPLPPADALPSEALSLIARDIDSTAQLSGLDLSDWRATTRG